MNFVGKAHRCLKLLPGIAGTNRSRNSCLDRYRNSRTTYHQCALRWWISKTTGMLVVTGGAPKIARGQKLVVGEPRPSASLLVKFWLPEFFFLNALSVRDDLLWSKAVCAFFRYV